jgi:hypothetical protein
MLLQLPQPGMRQDIVYVAEMTTIEIAPKTSAESRHSDLNERLQDRPVPCKGDEYEDQQFVEDNPSRVTAF